MYTLIFDFDGVIGDTFGMVMEIASRLVEELGTKKLTPEEVASLRDKGAREIFAELGVPLFKLPTWIKRVREEQAKSMEKAPLFKGIKELLLGLKKKGFCLGILTSNSFDNVKKFFNKNYLNLNLFDFIHTESSLFGKDKILRKLFKRYGLDPKKVIYVGDEVRDIEAAKRVEIKIIAVGWGYNTKKALMTQKPDFFVEEPEEILEILSRNCQINSFSGTMV